MNVLEPKMTLYCPVHPGVILREHMGSWLTVNELARHLGIAPVTVSMLLEERLSITADMATMLSEAFPRSRPEFWMALQAQYDLAKIQKQNRKPLGPIAV